LDLEVKRKILHASAAVLAVPFLLLFDLLIGVAVALAGLAVIWLVWYLEDRGEELEGPVGEGQRAIAKTMDETMRPEETFPWAPFYFVGGLVLVAVLSDWLAIPLSIAFAAYAVLGIGDAAGALIGKAYGSVAIPERRSRRCWRRRLRLSAMSTPCRTMWTIWTGPITSSQRGRVNVLRGSFHPQGPSSLRGSCPLRRPVRPM
jgi:hypothetical protein